MSGAQAPSARDLLGVEAGQIVFLSDRTPGLGSFAVAVMNGDGTSAHVLTHPEPRAIDPIWLPGGKQIAFKSVASPGDREVYGGIWLVRADGARLRWLLRQRASRASPDAAWSPDGKRMAIVRGSGLYLARADGSEARRVFRDARVLARPAWSPDGRRLALANGTRVVVLGVGSARAKVLFRTRTPASVYAPRWSPNGRMIAFIGVTPRGVSGLHVINVVSRQKRLLANRVEQAFLGTGPSWSPDSTRIVVGRVTSSWQAAGLSVIDVRTGRSRRISRSGSTPQWSPSGRRIAFAAYSPSGIGGVYLVRPDGSQRRLLVPFGATARFSPDGRRLAILTVGGSAAPIWGAGGAIYVVNIDGTHLMPVTHPFDDLAAVGSPDHRKVAFVRSFPGRPGTQESGVRSVYVVNGDGSGLRRIGRGNSVAWGPDSRQVVFASSGDVYSAAIGGGVPRQLTSGPEMDAAPAWSPDGTLLAFTRTITGSMRDVCLVSAVSPGPVNCLSAGGGNPAWSPEGTLIAFSVGDRGGPPESTGIGVIRPDGGGRRLLARGYAPAWAPDGRRLAFIDLSALADGVLAVVGVDGTGLTRLHRPVLPEPPTWSANGSRIASASCPPQIYDCEIWSAAPDGFSARALTANLIDDLAPVWWH